MIILDDRGWTMQQMILKNKEQIQGSQTWLDDIPGGLHTRCHYYIDKSSIDTYNKFLFLSVKRLFELLCHLKISIISWTIFHLQLTKLTQLFLKY